MFFTAFAEAESWIVVEAMMRRIFWYQPSAGGFT
jgi:hypothetical protein